MFNEEVKIGQYRVTIQLEGDLCRQAEQGWLFGFQTGIDPQEVNSYNLREILPHMRGYFLYLGYDSDRLVIANDMTGGYRLYTHEFENRIWLSDNLQWILDQMVASGTLTRNENEYKYWKRHRFTTGERTFIKGLNKLAPAGILEVTNTGISRDTYFPDTVCIPNHSTHRDWCRLDLEQTLEGLRAEKGPLVLMFSGGADSTLLAVLMQRLNIPFKAVFFRSQPTYKANHEDWLRARKVAESIGIDLLTPEINLDTALNQHRDFVRRTIFDRHTGVVLAEGLRGIARRFGNDAVVINGQGADNVLSFGPSERRPGSFASRLLLYWPFTLRARLAALAVSLRRGQSLRSPDNWREYYRAFFDPVAYNCLLQNDIAEEYADYIDDIVKSQAGKFSSSDSLQMYLKCYCYLQGSDNQVVIRGARAAGLPRVILPYCSYGFMAATIAAKDDRRELWRPKYVIHDMLADMGFKMPTVEKRTPDGESVNLYDLTKTVDGLYNACVDEMFAPRKSGERVPS